MGDITLKIMVKDGGLQVSTDKPCNILDTLQLTFSAQLGLLNRELTNHPDNEEIRQAIKEDLYDKYNYGASTVLEKFAPEIDKSPDLTVQAILEAENKIIDRRYSAMSKCGKGKKKGKGGK